MTSRLRFTAAQKAELWERWKNGKHHSFDVDGGYALLDAHEIRLRVRAAWCGCRAATRSVEQRTT